MVAQPIRVEPFSSLPEDVTELLELSLREGHDLVQRLVVDWRDGSNRFDQPGEEVLAARIGPRLVGVGGLNRDPYIDDPTVGRIRHLYVSPEARGRGVGRVLVMTLVDHARATFERVRLRTTGLGASEFYRALGFEETPDESDSTHQIRLR